MKMITRIVMITVLQIISVQLSFGQYQQHLHDNDSLYDWGWSILNNTDNTLHISGWSKNVLTGIFSIYNMNVSNDGSSILNKNIVRWDSANTYNGDQGQMKMSSDGGYIAPFWKQWPNAVTGYLYSAAGLVKYNAAGDTVFTRTYTDTSVHFDIMHACTIMRNGDYLIGGDHAMNTPSNAPAYIIRTNSYGDTVWTHTYQKDLSKSTTIKALQSLANGHILVGAVVEDVVGSSYTYAREIPWFIELDSAGYIVKDTLYSKGYKYMGGLYKDYFGGYFHIGAFDSLKTYDPYDQVNFPDYVAHFDTNFRMEWITEFTINEHYAHRYTENAIQLHDGNFLIIGEMAHKLNGYAWASKIDRAGKILWNHYYVSDTSSTAYFRDVAEQPNGDLVFVGATWNDTLPAWHQQQDVWIVKADSNGCVISGGCDPDIPGEINVVTTAPQPEALRLWPNPAAGEFTISSPAKGTLQICNMQGQQIAAYAVKPGNTELHLPAATPTGTYMCRYIPDDNSKPQSILRLVYSP